MDAFLGNAELVLASASPRRAMLLDMIGRKARVRPADIDEQFDPHLTPVQIAEGLALAKAAAVSAELPDSIVLGADTIVVLDGRVLGKPANEAEARSMLSELSGRVHTVVTGVAICRGSCRIVGHEQTLITFRTLTPAAIERYVATQEPMDKAGAYGIQGYGALLVSRIEGCYFNVVGLPLVRVAAMLREFDVELL